VTAQIFNFSIGSIIVRCIRDSRYFPLTPFAGWHDLNPSSSPPPVKMISLTVYCFLSNRAPYSLHDTFFLPVECFPSSFHSPQLASFDYLGFQFAFPAHLPLFITSCCLFSGTPLLVLPAPSQNNLPPPP